MTTKKTISAPKLLCTLEHCPVLQFPDKRVEFTADADIDADGANGQSVDGIRRVFAYGPRNSGYDALRNAGYPNGSYRDILVCGENTQPINFDGGYYSKTAYFREKEWNDPDRYLDSFSIPYIVVEGYIRRRAKGIVLGCLAKVTNLKNGKFTFAVVGDIGPLVKIGEISMKTAMDLSIPWNPRTGGMSDYYIKYELFPDTAAEINGEKFRLIAA